MYREPKAMPIHCEHDSGNGHVTVISKESRILSVSGDVDCEMADAFLYHLMMLSQKNSSPILLIVNSTGGDVNDGLAMVDLIRAINAPIHSLVTGLCCSAATLFASCCHVRYAFPSSFFLIHELARTSASDTKFSEAVEDTMVMEDMMHRMVSIYRCSTGAPVAQIRADLKESKWLTSQGALAYGKRGLIDKIVTKFPPPWRNLKLQADNVRGKDHL